MGPEGGELFDAVKKWCVYNDARGLDINNIIEELGDIEFYLEGIRQSLNITREATLHANVDKLRERYEKKYGVLKYSDDQAAERADKIETGETTKAAIVELETLIKRGSDCFESGGVTS